MKMKKKLQTFYAVTAFIVKMTWAGIAFYGITVVYVLTSRILDMGIYP
jgi:hypothetical protein